MAYKYQVQFDSVNRNELHIFLQNNNICRLVQCPWGLYYSDIKDDTAAVLVNTVADDQSKFSPRDHFRDLDAKRFQSKIVLSKIVTSRRLADCTLTASKVKAAVFIWGESMVCLKGKPPWWSTPYIQARIMSLPVDILEQYREVTLTVYVMFINGLRFVITKSCNILFTTSEHIINGNSKTLLASLKEVNKLYTQHGFKIRTILMDGQFECLHWDLSRMKINLSTYTYNALVGEIERIILAIKESACGIFNTLPFTKLTGCIIVELLSFVVFWLNVLGESIASDLSLFTVMKGLTVSYKRHCVIKFCEYVQTH